MIIRNITIHKLYGEYDYDVNINEDLTFLYGSNGCGKTTILNILTSIVNGKLYFLFKYTFEKIILKYYDVKTKDEDKEILIMMNYENEMVKNMKVVYENSEYIFENVDRFYRNHGDFSEEREFHRFCLKYPFVKDLKKCFNFIYLPLNRSVDFSVENDLILYSKNSNSKYRNFENMNYSYLNEALERLHELITDTCYKISYKESKINEQFRNEILQDSLTFSTSYPIHETLEGVKDFDKETLNELKIKFFKMLNTINIKDDSFECKINQFFNDLDKINKYDNLVDDGTNRINVIDFMWQYNQLSKMRRYIDIAEKYEVAKVKVRKSMELFKLVLNDFFISSGSRKRVYIDKSKVKFKEYNNILELDNLSSGENQLFITFASLIFGLRDNERGVFIVDEPESSLHLEWQNQFVDKIFQTERKVQMIFATHSPEIIGKYRSKAVRLEKKYSRK